MSDARVAVYIDFDNMVISRYDAVHGSGRWRKDNARDHTPAEDGEVSRRLIEAEVDLGAIIDYASSFGTVAFTRAYADWSVPANAAYKRQLTDRAVDLVQLFATSGTKNGADIRLSIDAVNDLFQHADITHVVVVGGDSDYIALAQRCKQLGRFVVGIGVTGSTSRALVAACDDFSSYGDLPGVSDDAAAEAPGADAGPVASTPAKPVKKAAAKSAKARKTATSKESQATALLRRAIRIGAEKSEDGWQHSSSLKSQMQRLDSTFKEKSLGFSSFRAFVESHDKLVETKLLDNGQLAVRLR
ncbi:NYN domain-containing protein [Flexivirga lutea]